jgi:hypothetical protein
MGMGTTTHASWHKRVATSRAWWHNMMTARGGAPQMMMMMGCQLLMLILSYKLSGP